MTKINRKIEYSLMALKLMLAKKPGELSTSKEICEVTGAPFDATAKVMQVMAQNGLLKSEQGVHGGYQIIKNLNDVSFYSLTEMLLGPVAVSKCAKSEVQCELLETCNIQSPILTINSKLIEFYKNLSLKEILEPKQTRAEVFNPENVKLGTMAEQW